MSLSTLPLSYCGNVHPVSSVADLLLVLSQKTASVQQIVAQPIAAGLWLANDVTCELSANTDLIQQLQQVLAENNLICYTLNAFPFGNFHQERVKEQVYLPDWSDPARYDYTVRCLRLLSQLLPAGVEGSVSTVPLAFKQRAFSADFDALSLSQLLNLARFLDELHDETGQVIRLAIEPEPLCLLETTDEAIQFFQRLFAAAEKQNLLDPVRRHIGLCYDVCHQSVEYEDVAASIAAIQQADIRINKVHITCAVQLDQPATNQAGREFLATFAEPRYLHQTLAFTTQQRLIETDLSPEFVKHPPAEWLSADSWRIHFHVPVHATELGPLATTRPDLMTALQKIRELEYAPHLEVETYTWTVMPNQPESTPPDVCQELARELRWTLDYLKELG